jgi:starch synthase
MAFQGRLSPDAAAAAPGLDPAVTPGAAAVLGAMVDAAGRTGPGGVVDLNLLQGGIAAAHAVTTVSPTYAREVLGLDAGCGLERVLGGAAAAGKFTGVLNGIDSAEGFDPAADAALAANFCAAAPWPGKDACKRALLAELGFAPDGPPAGGGATDGDAAAAGGAPTPAPPPDTPPLFDDGAGGAHPGGRPLLAIVSRLSAQKGLDLMEAMVAEGVARGARVVVLGTAPDPADAARFASLASAAEGGQDARYRLCFSDALARRIYAGADALLVPSRYEPCGLAQLIALRYGTIPIVRRTGGLADTVVDIADGCAPEAVRNGVVFDGLDHGAARGAVRRALDAYRAAGGGWWRGVLVPRAAGQDWSWSRSAAAYLDVYRRAMGVRG